MIYQKQYHRCVYKQSETYEGFLFLIVPLLILITLYILIITVIVKNKIKVTKVIVTTSGTVVNESLQSIGFVRMPQTHSKMMTILTASSFRSFYFNAMHRRSYRTLIWVTTF